MKKLIAKICIWILGKLGYNNTYRSEDAVIKINVDTSEAVRNLKVVIAEIDRLKKSINGL